MAQKPLKKGAAKKTSSILAAKAAGTLRKGAKTFNPKKGSLIIAKKARQKLSAAINNKNEQILAAKARSSGSLSILLPAAKKGAEEISQQLEKKKK